MSTLREQLKETLDEAEWGWLAPHLARGAVILVSQELDLLEAAEKVARDEKALVQEWISGGLLSKPTDDQMKAWNAAPSRKFLVVIVSPFVLAQEMLVH